MAITVHPYNDHGAMAVLSRLDAHDLIEAQLIRGEVASHLAIFADWRSVEGARILSYVLSNGPSQPFAVLGLSHTGQAGVAQAALLARDHNRFRYALSRAAVLIRQGLPEFCATHGIHRIEARCWSAHPTAADFLGRCGFKWEADMPGFGATGDTIFSQFAWINPNLEKPHVL